MKFVITLLLLQMLLSLPTFAFQQQDCEFTVQGRVIDHQSGKPLLAASIFLENARKGVITDDQGYFVFSNLCPGRHTLIVQHLGYAEKKQSILMEKGKNLDLEISLSISNIQLQQVTIDGLVEPLSNIRKEVLDATAISQSNGQNLGQVLSQINGVSSLKTGPGITKPVIHGLHSSRILILNNGIRQEGQQWGSEHAPEIDPYIASKITVVKGAESVRYGSDAIGGLIVVGPPDLHRTKTIGGEVNLAAMTNSGMMLGSGMLEGGIGKSDKFGWRVQGTYKKAGDSHTPDYVLTNSGIREFNFSGGLGYESDRLGVEFFYSHFTTELGILRSAHTGSRTDFMEAISRDRPLIVRPFSYEIDHPKQQISHDLYKMNAFYKIKENQKTSVVYGGQINNRLEFDRRRGEMFSVPGLDLTLTTHTLDATWDTKYKETWLTTLGVTGMAQMNRWDPNTGKNPLIPWYNQTSIGAFAIQRYVKPKWEAELGVRYDRKDLAVKIFNRQNELINGQYDFDNFTLNAGGQYSFSDAVSVSSHLGSAWRPPHVSELFSNGIHHGTASYESGLLINDRDDVDSNLSDQPTLSEISYKWVNGLEYKKNKIAASIDIYVNSINNFIYLSPEPGSFVLTSRGDFPLFKYHQIDALMKGMDASLTYELTKGLRYQFKASIVRAMDRQSKEFIIWMPPDQFENSLMYSFHPKGKIEDFHFSLGSLIVLRQSRIGLERDFTTPPLGYFLMNAHIGTEFPVGEKHLQVSINIDNLLNTRYRDYMNRFRYFADDLGRNFSISIKYNFHNHN